MQLNMLTGVKWSLFLVLSKVSSIAWLLEQDIVMLACMLSTL